MNPVSRRITIARLAAALLLALPPLGAAAVPANAVGINSSGYCIVTIQLLNTITGNNILTLSPSTSPTNMYSASGTGNCRGVQQPLGFQATIDVDGAFFSLASCAAIPSIGGVVQNSFDGDSSLIGTAQLGVHTWNEQADFGGIGTFTGTGNFVWANTAEIKSCYEQGGTQTLTLKGVFSWQE